MTLPTILCITLTSAYVGLMALYRKGWLQQPEFTVPANYIPVTRISVVIPARNEAANIGACLDAILGQKYPDYLFEIIVVDDHSTDDTAAIVAGYASDKIQLIRLADYIPMGTNVSAYKKLALAAGINKANGELIVTTDADCTAPNAWLLHIGAMYERNYPAMIVAPVIYSCKRTVLQLFQLLDFMSMQGITAAAHALHLGNMSNGANLAFRKDAFETVEGYDGIQHLASGDDYLLMVKMNKRFPGAMSYLKSQAAIVSTLPQPDWRSFLQQRIRWASKSGKYNDIRLTLILMLVYCFNLMLFTLIAASLFDSSCILPSAIILCIKIIVELWYLLPVARFFSQERNLWYFPFFQPLHVAYIVLAGFLGFVGVYEWKGRRVR